MNQTVRRVAALSVLWAMCELLIPNEKYRQAVRMTAGLLVISVLLSSAGNLLGSETLAQPAVARSETVAQQTYLRVALTSAANQLRSYCEHVAQRAGYQADACVFLAMDGAVERIEITLRKDGNTLLSPDELCQTLAQQMEIDAQRILLMTEDL